MDGLQKTKWFGIAAGVGTLLVLLIMLVGGFGLNNTQDWQIKQSVGGNVSVIDEAGWYTKWFATIYTYPRAYQAEYADADAIRVTFNDGGTAKISTMLRFGTPKATEARLTSHQQFGSIENMSQSVRAHLVNCIKATGPLMSSSEHQSARKSEFRQIVENQLRKGIYEMRKVERVLADETDESGRQIKVFATEIITDEKGIPVISQESPLAQYDIEVLQFSVLSTTYDGETLQKFAAKKESFLRSEQFKADREAETQERLMIVERGKKELAEVEAQANKEKMTATVNAEREAEVARIEAEQRVVVAEQTKLAAEMLASQQLEVAKLELEAAKVKAETAEQEAAAISVLAAAEEEKIAKAGAITEHERVLAEIRARRDVDVAAKLAGVQVPKILLMGGKEGQGGSMTDTLINLRLLKSSGIIADLDAETAAQKRQNDKVDD